MDETQADERFTKVPNEILERIMKIRFNATQSSIILAIWRYTYGFHRSEHGMSLGFLEKAIKANRTQIDRELTVLIDLNVVSHAGFGPRKVRILRINENFNEWLIGRDSNEHNSSLYANERTVVYADQSTELYANERNKKERSLKKVRKKNNTSDSSNPTTSYFLTNYDSFFKEEIEDILVMFYQFYRAYKGVDHPKLKVNQLERVYAEIENALMDDGHVVNEDAIREFFKNKKSDHNLNHFATKGMLEILSYRVR